MKKLNILLFLLIISLVISPFVSSYMPTTHYLVTKETLKEPIDSEAYRVCAKYPAECWSGNILTDVSVIFYYTERGKYSTTHSPSFIKALVENAGTEQEKACVSGAMIHHSSDIESHTIMVPQAIQKTKIVNNVIHVFTEQHLDNKVVKVNPFLQSEAYEKLKGFEACVPLFKKALVGNTEYTDLTSEEIDTIFSKFISEVVTGKTGYDPAFKNKSFFVNIKSIPFVIIGSYLLFMVLFLLLSILLLFKIARGDRRIRMFIGLIIFLPILILMLFLFIGNLQGSAFNNFVTVIKPISNLVPIGNADAHLNQAIENSIQVLTQGEIWLEKTEASGFHVLDQADRNIKLFDYLILLVLAMSLISFIFFLFRKNKSSPRGALRL